MPRGTATPAEKRVRFFVAADAITIECPTCGHPFTIDAAPRRAVSYNQLRGIAVCPGHGRRSCGGEATVEIFVKETAEARQVVESVARLTEEM